MNNMINAPATNSGVYELRLITKAIGFLAVVTGVLYLRVVVAEGMAIGLAGRIPLETTLLFVFLAVATLGLLLAWQWEGVGGLIALLSGVSLAILDYSVYERNQWFAAFLYSSPFIISGALCLVCWWRRRPVPEAKDLADN